ncbi:hypothetical protein NQ318_021155 [Aromia moschata]|uniref:Syndecan/Neurexin domain-containing protein n=1 Tax=Aromia moschata TaxID=1265417 RepID=A0AAV8YGC9_9CUCU|nr:hypothetical protein NQ318_021155 [Aromia moschata]
MPQIDAIWIAYSNQRSSKDFNFNNDDADIEGSGYGGEVNHDLESSGSGFGSDDEDDIEPEPPQSPYVPVVNNPAPPRKTEPENDKESIEIDSVPSATEDSSVTMNKKSEDRPTSFFAQPGILAAVIGGAVVGLLCAILVVMFIVYRMRKKRRGIVRIRRAQTVPQLEFV